MKYILFLFLLLSFSNALAADIREVYKDSLIERERVAAEVDKDLKNLRADRDSITSKINTMEREYKSVLAEIKRLKSENADLQMEYKKAEQTVLAVNKDMQAIENTVSAASADFSAIVSGVPVFMRANHNSDSEDVLIAVSNLADKYKEFIINSSQVRRLSLPVLMEDGLEKSVDVIALGVMGYIYLDSDKAGYLETDANGNLVKIRQIPSYISKNVNAYFAGETDSLGVDFSSGAVYEQWKNRITPSNQIKKGGLLVYPIFAAAFLAFLLISERVYYLYIKSSEKTDEAFEIISKIGQCEDSEILSMINLNGKKTPTARVLSAVFNAKNTKREVRADILEQVLIDESIKLERNMSLLSVVAAIAPMLGLIGTVTGMISTFHAITVFGSGDPGMMAGGISEALTTTMLGLTVAVPVMLVNTLLSRRAENIMDSLQKKGMCMHNALGADN